ncbi:MAG: tyrosine-type recombinase/integrase, partial [Candidatus Bathyarchaeia archaeon]
DNGLPQPSSQPPKCPECGSSKVWRDGLRYLSDGRAVQRWLCRLCGYRFSQAQVKLNIAGEQLESFHPGSNLAERTVSDGDLPIKKALNNSALSVAEDFRVHNVTNLGKDLNTLCSKFSNCRVLRLREGAKNSAGTVLVPMEEKAYAEGRAAGATENPKVSELLFNFAWWMKKQGYAEQTIESRVKILNVLAKRGADLLDPENVKSIIARQRWSAGRKENAVIAYSTFLKMIGKTWEPPRYRREETLPWIPLETEIDQLIAGCSPRMATFLQLLKETGIRAGEAWRLKWSDIDFEQKMVYVRPEKGSKARVFRMSPKLEAMLRALPRKNDYVFNNGSLEHFACNFRKQRRRIAAKLKNPRINMISFKTLRHWKATMEYYKTRDILYVMEILGHKQIQNTLKYTHLVRFDSDEYTCRVAETPEDITQLIEAGFEYVCEHRGLKFFRKRK